MDGSDYRVYEQGLLVGAGAVWNKVALEFRWETSNGMSGIPNVHSAVNSFFLQASFAF